MQYRFMGDEEDPQTKRWGLKRLKDYEVIKKKNFYGSGLVAKIKIGEKMIECPYQSENAFSRNWKLSS